jgi:hypothetical protein
MNDQMTCAILKYPLARIKAVRKAVKVLVAIGMPEDQALGIVLSSADGLQARDARLRIERYASR